METRSKLPSSMSVVSLVVFSAFVVSCNICTPVHCNTPVVYNDLL